MPYLDLDKYDKPSYIPDMIASLGYNNGGFISICGNTNNLYLVSPASGVKYIRKKDLSYGTPDWPVILDNKILYDLNYPKVKSPAIYVHCTEDQLAIVSVSGIDVYTFRPQLYRSSTLAYSGETFEKCFITNSKKLYYVVSGTNYYSLRAVYNLTSNWQHADKEYKADNSTFLAGAKITDIYVNDIDNKTTLFVSTTKGVYVIDDDSGYIKVYNSKF